MATAANCDYEPINANVSPQPGVLIRHCLGVCGSNPLSLVAFDENHSLRSSDTIDRVHLIFETVQSSHSASADRS